MREGVRLSSYFDVHDLPDHQLRQNQASDRPGDQSLAIGMVVKRHHVAWAEDHHHGGDAHGKDRENYASKFSMRRESADFALQRNRFAHILGYPCEYLTEFASCAGMQHYGGDENIHFQDGDAPRQILQCARLTHTKIGLSRSFL